MIYAKSLQANFSHFERDGCEWIGIMTDAAVQKSGTSHHLYLCKNANNTGCDGLCSRRLNSLGNGF